MTFFLSSCRDREHSSRFAIPGSFEYEFGQKWKALYQLHKDQEELLKRNFNEEVAKLEMDMETAQLEQHTVKMRQGALSVDAISRSIVTAKPLSDGIVFLKTLHRCGIFRGKHFLG